MSNAEINRIRNMLTLMVMLLCLSSMVNALGIAPAWQDHDFEPAKEIESSIRIINDKHTDFRALVYVQGMFADKIELEQQIYEVDASQDSVIVPFKFKMPQNIFKPGKHTTKIVVLKLPKSISEEQFMEDGEIKPTLASVSATAQVIAKFNVKVPYDGKYLDGQVYISQANANQDTSFSIALYSIGTEDINRIKGKIKIINPNNQTIDEIETNEISLRKKMESRIAGTWKAKAPGEYMAIVTIEFDGQTLKLQKKFSVGNLMINITNVAVEHYKLGEIVKFDIYLKNLWNKPLKGVYAVFKAFDKDKELVKYKTTSIDLETLGYGVVNAFWDTKNLLPGAYTIKLVIYYANQKTETELDTKIDYNEIDITTFGKTGNVITEKAKIGRDSVLSTLVIILIIINLSWFFYFKRKARKKTEKEAEKPAQKDLNSFK